MRWVRLTRARVHSAADADDMYDLRHEAACLREEVRVKELLLGYKVVVEPPNPPCVPSRLRQRAPCCFNNCAHVMLCQICVRLCRCVRVRGVCTAFVCVCVCGWCVCVRDAVCVVRQVRCILVMPHCAATIRTPEPVVAAAETPVAVDSRDTLVVSTPSSCGAAFSSAA